MSTNGSSPSESIDDSDDNSGQTPAGASPAREIPLSDLEAGLACRGSAKDRETGWIDEVVVENLASPELWKAGVKTTNGPASASTSPEDKEGAAALGGINTGSQQGSSIYRGASANHSGWFSKTTNIFSRRVWPFVFNFFAPRFVDPRLEEAYQREMWSAQKPIHIAGSLFLLINMILNMGLTLRPWSLWLTVLNFALGPAFTLPLIPMALFNWPLKKNRLWIWQLIVFFALWFGSSGYILDTYLCNYYGSQPTCGKRDPMSTYFFSTALPIVALFSLGLKRIVVLVACVSWICLVGVTIVPIHVQYLRTLINWAIFQCFVLVWHYLRECSDRRTYTLRQELKVQFKAKQKAQVNERKTMDARNRMTHYIFHEVRVPLNTALLAAQNLKADGVADSAHAVEYAALDSSLQMMSQVLNDVLDFSRMEKGGFSSVSRPFSLHRAMRSLVAPLTMDATSRGLKVETSFDPAVDAIAMQAAWGDDHDSMNVNEGDGMVVGDEMRLRQVVTNLTSNALKFSNPGGKVSVKTTLIYPSPQPPPASPALIYSPTGHDSDMSGATLVTPATPSTTGEKEALADGSETIVVRIEVSDQGVGISPKDMKGLFSAYVQTQAGLSQGGKGTGLGLSLVRHIVSLTGGRLGIKSHLGKGTTIWIEMPYTVGTATREEVIEVDFAREERLAAALATPQSYSDNQVEFDFLLPSAIPRKTSDERLLGNGSSLLPVIESGDPTPLSTPLQPPRDLPPGTFSLTLPPTAVTADSVSSHSSPQSSRYLPLASPMEERGPPSFSSTSPARPPLNRARTQSQSQNSLHFARGPLRVLVVDDDQLTRRLMRRMMERLGCEVSDAENGAIALEMLAQPLGNEQSGDAISERFDVTFLDNQMPVCSGIQMITRLRAMGRKDFVVGVTANALIQDQEEFSQQGASVVLTKPVKEADLRDLLIAADVRRSSTRPITPLAPPVPK
ncbi:hypothetical protein T439DRAFT_353841 [Meredithblackwellia eburnea MCA 4105]